MQRTKYYAGLRWYEWALRAFTVLIALANSLVLLNSVLKGHYFFALLPLIGAISCAWAEQTASALRRSRLDYLAKIAGQ